MEEKNILEDYKLNEVKVMHQEENKKINLKKMSEKDIKLFYSLALN
jgi:hypothetical protein